jgi:hypothetical protein
MQPLNSRDPKLLANIVKHFAFTRCGESNLFGMVDAQLAECLEAEVCEMLIEKQVMRIR